MKMNKFLSLSVVMGLCYISCTSQLAINKIVVPNPLLAKCSAIISPMGIITYAEYDNGTSIYFVKKVSFEDSLYTDTYGNDWKLHTIPVIGEDGYQTETSVYRKALESEYKLVNKLNTTDLLVSGGDVIYYDLHTTVNVVNCVAGNCEVTISDILGDAVVSGSMSQNSLAQKVISDYMKSNKSQIK